MRPLAFILQKEFLQIFRNRAMLPILFVMPVVQLLVLSSAATFEVKQSAMSLIDDDGSTTSFQLIERFEASGFFTVVQRTHDPAAADDAMQRGQARLIVHIPHHFERDLQTVGRASIDLTLDAVDGASAGVVQSYAASILAAFNQERQRAAGVAGAEAPPRIEVVSSHWYNADLDYKTYMVPGILVVLVTMIGMFLSAMNVVREKEIGTIEQLNVTPLRKAHFIIGKLLPFWVIGLVDLAIGLVLAHLVFGVQILGNIGLIFVLAAVYLLGILALGLWISTITDTQQQAMFIAWFIMVICMLMSGLFTPIESMPAWAQKLTLLNPVAYFIQIMRQVLLKGAGMADVQPQIAFLSVFAVAMMTMAVRQYRKIAV
ncbi:MAG: ABC transporter permease [Rhodothermales bacterium]|nr:ABC transporter permease [Rhodothermales bacterium]